MQLELVTNTVAAKQVKDIFISVMGNAPPSDADWDALIEFASRMARQSKGILVSADAGPNSAQRAKIAKVEALKAVPTAIISSSAVIRGIATAFSWLGSRVKGFSPQQIDDALDFLQIDHKERPATRRQLDELSTRFAGRKAG